MFGAVSAGVGAFIGLVFVARPMLSKRPKEQIAVAEVLENEQIAVAEEQEV